MFQLTPTDLFSLLLLQFSPDVHFSFLVTAEGTYSSLFPHSLSPSQVMVFSLLFPFFAFPLINSSLILSFTIILFSLFLTGSSLYSSLLINTLFQTHSYLTHLLFLFSNDQHHLFSILTCYSFSYFPFTLPLPPPPPSH